MLHDLNRRLREAVDDADQGQGGFTLIELLVVITILGILAAVAVFSVAGLGDKGQAAACKTDTSTLRTAEEANYAKFTTYATQAQLVTNGFLSNQSTIHNISTTPAQPAAGPYTAYTITVAPNQDTSKPAPCGTAGGTVDGSNNGNT